jgi:hypothetical protein
VELEKLGMQCLETVLHGSKFFSDREIKKSEGAIFKKNLPE